MRIPKQLQKSEFNFVLLRKSEKIPFQNGWQKKNIKFNDSELIKHLNGSGNYGVMGGGERNLIIVDFDNEELQHEIIKKLPETFTVVTGSGLYHKYFYSDNSNSFKIYSENLDTLLDVQGKGKQVVAPNSIHPNGNSYKIIQDKPIAFIPYSELKAIIIPYDKKPKKQEQQKQKYESNPEFENNFIETVKERVSMDNVLSVVGVDTSTTPTNCPFHDSKGGKCFGFNQDTWHCFHCEESGNIFSMIMKVKKLSFADSLKYFAENFGLQDEYDSSRREFLRKLDKKSEPQEVKSEITKYDYLIETKKGYIVNVQAVANYIRDKHHFVTIYGKTHEEIWNYDDGIYILKGRELIETETEELLEEYSKSQVVYEILKKIKRQTAISREQFDDIPKELIPLNNGILNVVTKEFVKYSPGYYFKTKINVEYNPEAKCLLWDDFVEQTFYPDDIPVVQEWWGFCLYRDYFIKKGFLGFGEGDTGKSVFQGVLLKFFGSANTSGLNLQKITSDNNFSKSYLYNKYVNLFDDMSSQDINDGGGFKMTTGRSPITAEYKFGDEFQFINYAKMTFCCNKIPPIKDTDDMAYYNRWLPIPFDSSVAVSEQDNFLSDKLTTPDELSGILNWGLIGLKRLLENGVFTFNKTSTEIQNLMQRNSHPLAEFTHDCLYESPGNKITKETMYEAYSQWATKKKKSRDTIEKLGRNLPRYAKYILAKREKERYWLNASLKIDY